MRPQGSLPSDTIPNSKRDEGIKRVFSISTRRSKILKKRSIVVEDDDDEEELPLKYAFPKVKSPKVPKVALPKIDDPPKFYEVPKQNVPLMVNETPEVHQAPSTSQNVKEAPSKENEPSNEARKEAQRVYKQLPRMPPPFPQRFAKQQQEGQLQKFYDMLNKITINVPFVEALEKMLGYAKFMKNLVTKKKNVNFETIKVTHQCSAIISQIGVEKIEDPGAFTIPCAIGLTSFTKSLCDLGASINLMPYAVFKKLGLGDPRPTTMKLLTADRTLKKPLGVIDDVLVKVDRFYFPVDFVILDCEVDIEIPIILGRPFLETRRAICDDEAGELKFRLNNEEAIFHIQKSIKQPHDYGVISVVDVVDDVVDDDMEDICMQEALQEVLLNSNNEAMKG
ncbi:uncharacterized protein [Nicotiana tomentosiformis]|uniref:uncharacterized protein n=1 Tax=Nicotiana tomentosiformis TaxID=4098 RepID=UPI00051C9E29|nr:uncharacterized protein LOC104098980 [Nicotiana tomentosiformis]